MPMTNSDLRLLLNVAAAAAKNASLDIDKNQLRSKAVHRDLRHDIKIAADKISEKMILNKLAKDSLYPVLSEESGLTGGKTDNNGYRWIVDPLDGSLNYLRRIPFCCISISLWKKDEPVIGVVLDFNRHECFTAIVGVGAWLNDRPIHVSNVNNKSQAILCTGFPSGATFSNKELSRVISVIKRFKKVRWLGSAALSLAYVACGRTDFYYEHGINLWDVAAGLCLVKAAGGSIRFKSIQRKQILSVHAANACLHLQ